MDTCLSTYVFQAKAWSALLLPHQTSYNVCDAINTPCFTISTHTEPCHSFTAHRVIHN